MAEDVFRQIPVPELPRYSADSIAVTEVIELTYPYVSIRVGDKIWVD